MLIRLRVYTEPVSLIAGQELEMRLCRLALALWVKGWMSVPDFVQVRVLRQLAVMTAEAFGCEPPQVRGTNGTDLLEVYARFTSREAEKLLLDGRRLRQVELSLFRRSRLAGERYARVFSLASVDDAVWFMRLFYRVLGIELSPESGSDGLSVSRCFFSAFYSAETCRVMSALDRGFAEGLSGGRVLRFDRRITEGASCCRAVWGP